MNIKQVTSAVLGLLMIGSIAAEVPVIEPGMPIEVPAAWSAVGNNLYGAGSNMCVAAQEAFKYMRNPLPESVRQVAVDTSKLVLDHTAFLARHPVALLVATGITAYLVYKLHQAYQRGWKGLFCKKQVERETTSTVKTKEIG